MPPFWVGFSKQRKKPDWRRSSNCVQNAFFQLSPSGRNEKTPLGSNFTISVSCHHFGWAFPSSGKSRIDEGRPIAFKTRFFNFPHRGETKKHPWDRIWQFRFHATILGGLFQAAEKAGLTKVVQLRSKCVFSTFPVGAKRKNTLGIEFYNFGFMPPFWVGFSKQRKKPDWRRSSNCVQNAFFQLSPSGRNEKTPLGSNFTISVSCHHFGWAFPSSGKSRIDEGRPIAFKTRFFNFPHRGETKKHPWDRIWQFRFHATILGGLFQAAEKAGLTKVVQLRSKCVFSTFPVGAKRKNTLGIEFYNFGFMPPFWVGFSKQRKKPDWRRSSNCVQNAFFQLSPSGRNEKTPLGSNFTISVSCHHFGWAFPSSGKSRIDEGRPIAFKTRFFNFPHRGETKKHPWDRILQFRFHATILGGLFQAAEKAGLTKVVQLRSKCVFSTFPVGAKRKKNPRDRIWQFRFHATILGGLFQAAEKAGLTKVVQLRSKCVFSTFPVGAKRKNTLGIEFYNFGFMPPFWVGFSKQRKKPDWRRSSNCVQNAFFQLSPSGRNEKTPLGSNLTISVSCHHFGWAFPSSGKSRIDEGRPIAFKTRFFNFPHRGETKKHPWDRILQFRFHAIGKSHFGWAFPSSGKSRIDEGRPIAFKTRIGAKRKKNPWDRIWQFRFHATILGGLFQAAEKAGLTKVVQLRSKRVFSTFPIGAKRKNTLGIEFDNFGFMPPFWVGFSKQRKKPDWRRSSNCVQNAFFQLSPSGRNEKTPLGSNLTISVSCHHFGWAFPSSGKSRIDEGRPIAFKTRFFNFPHRGETKKHPWDRILQFRFHATILGGLFQAAEKAGLTKVVQLRSKCVFSTFPVGAKRKNTLGIEFDNFGFMPPFWVGFSKQRKKPDWRTNCVQNAFFQLSNGIEFYNCGFMPPFLGFSKQRKKLTKVVQLRSKRVFSTFPIGAKRKNTLGSNLTISVSCHHFGWAFRIDEGRPIAFKTRFSTFPIGAKRKKNPRDRILQFRFHATILGGLFQAAEKAGLTKVVQLRSKCVFSTFPVGAKRKKNPRDRIWQFRFHATILGGLFQAAEKAGLTKVVQLRSKCVFSTFPVGAKRKNTLGIEFYNFGFMPPFWVGFSKQRKKPDWRRSSNCVQNAFFQLSPSGRNEKTPLGSNLTISVSCHHFGWAFPSSGKSRIDEGRPIAFKTRFFNFPHRGETKKHPWDRIWQFRFHATILGGLFQAAEKAGLTKVVQLRSKRVFSTFPIGAKRKNTLGIEFDNFGFMPPFWVGFSKQRKKPDWRRSSNCVQNAFFQLSPSGRNEKTPLGSNFTISVSCHHFGWAFPSSGKSRIDEGRPIAFKTRFFNFPHRGETKKHPWDRIWQFRFHATILGGLFQAAEKAGLTKVVQLRSKCVFSTFPVGAKRKNTLGIEFYNFGFMPPFWVGFSKQRKKPDWRRSSNCVQNAFFQLSPSGRNEKTPLGSNFTISVSCHHFGWAFPSSGKSRIDEGRPIAFKTRFFNFPHRGETKKHPWDRIWQFRFHATILGGLFQAAEKAGLTKVVQLRSKRVFSTFPIGAKRKNTLGIEFYNFGFMPPFWVGFSKQRKKPDWRRSSNCVQNAFFQLSPSGRNEKIPLGSNFTISVSCHHFGWAFPSSGKSRIDEGRPIAFKTRFFNFPHRGETKKHPWDRIWQFRFHATILGGLFQAAEKAGLTKVVQLRSKRVFSTFPIGAKRKNTLGIEFYNFGFMPPFWVGFSKQRKKPDWRRSSNCVQNAFFQLSPSGRNEKTPLGSNLTISVSCHHFGWAFPSSGKSRIDEGRPIAFKMRFFNFPRRGETKKTPLGSNFTISVSCHHFGWAFPSSGKSRIDEGRPIAFKTRFFNFPHRGETKKHPWDRIWQFRFHATILGGLFQAAEKAGLTKVVQLRSKCVFSTFPVGAKRKKNPRDRILQFRFHATILGGLFQAAEKAGLTKVVQLRSKRVFSTFPIGAKRKNTLGIEFDNFGFMPPFWVGFSKQRKKPDWRRSSNCVQNAFFQLSPSGRNEKIPLGSNFTISVSCHHFGWAFPSSGKSRIDEGRPIAFKTRFFNFPHRGETKKHPWDRVLQFRFHATILGGLFQAAEKAGLTKVVQLRSKRVFSTFPIGAKRKNILGIEFDNFGFMPPFWVGFSKQRKKPDWRRSSNCVQNAFLQLSHRGETKKYPWDRILQFRFHATILGGLFQAAEKAGLTKVVQLRSKRVFSTFPIGAKRKNTLKIEFDNFGFMPPFWVGFSKQRKKPDWRRSSNCVQNAFFQLSPSGRNEKKTLGIEFYNFGFMPPFWVGFSKQRKKPDWRRSTNCVQNAFFQLSPSGRNEKTPLGSSFKFRFHATILGGLFQAAEKAGLTKVVQLRSKRVFSTFPIGAKRKNILGIEFDNFGFMPPFWVGFSKQRKKPDWRRSSNCVQNAFFQLSPSGRNEKIPLGSNFTISVSCHHFGWAFPSSGKSRIDEGRPIAFKTRFFNFPHRGETKKHPWDRIWQFRFHATILGGLFQAAEKAGLTKVVQLRSKCVFSTFPVGAKRKKNPRDRILQFRFHATILGGLFQAAEKAGLTKVVQLRSKRVFSTFPVGAKRKNTLGIEIYNFGFMPPFWVGFSKQRKKPGSRRSSNCVQNAFFQLSPSGRNEKTP